MPRSSRAEPLNVALLMETSRSFGRGVIRGVARYAHLHGPWVFHLSPGDLHPELPPPGVWDGDAVIGRIEGSAMRREIERRGLQVVCLGGDEFLDRRYVGTGSESVCRTAIDYLVDRGFTRLAYYGGTTSWGSARGALFHAQARQRGLAATLFAPRRVTAAAAGHEVLMRTLVDWLDGLDKPVAVLASDDLSGRQLIDACAIAGLHVPEQVAILGIDNDELICELARPSLSSVAINGERIGFESARILHDLVGGAPPPAWLEIEPLGVVDRQSTELLAIEDADVATALRHIRQNACDGVTVGQVVARVSVSRKTLEERFKRTLGRTPQMEISRVQMERAKDLLVKSELKLSTIAQKSGFTSVQYLHAAFKRELGTTPQRYRARNRSTGV